MPEWKGRVPLTRSHCERITWGSSLPIPRFAYDFAAARALFINSARPDDAERAAGGPPRDRRVRLFCSDSRAWRVGLDSTQRLI
ncbi:hypothetical protein EVAR_80864_1 [Eumeta japonica]|uniref:Uncharacterized protein n=1 Tax=Eumeta variegata TaxID=151549 RepID=A0A4C1V036_EUMVA|nr:hypothetical protein EVAR_80864_1 [Eumeta japonica]